VDLNLMHPLVNQVVMPDNRYARAGTAYFGFSFVEGRRPRGLGYSHASNWGPIETVGDILRADDMKWVPGWYLAGGGHSWWNAAHGLPRIMEQGFTAFGGGTPAPDVWKGDDDGDGIFNERDERDMIFTWAVNYLTTRSSVFDIDMVVDLCDPPYYPERDGEPVKLPFPTFKTLRWHARKRVLGVIDRSTCLRIDRETGACDFTGPVTLRLKRLSDDRRVP
jgi:hypothetical protein